MKILKRGVDNTTLPTMEVSCTGKGISQNIRSCGALLEINGLDIFSDVHYDYTGGSDRYYFVICPICGAKTEVYRSNMPEGVSSLIK